MNFETLHLDRDEHVILEVRKHWIIFAAQAFGLITAALLPIILFFIFKFFAPTFFNYTGTFNISTFFTFCYSLWVLALWVSFFVDWTKYYLDVWYVTERRIIAVQQKKIFDREITNLRFDKIQDITIDIHGFIPTLLHFGNVKVQTASEDNLEFVMNTVRYPDEVRRVIFNQQNRNSDGGFK